VVLRELADLGDAVAVAWHPGTAGAEEVSPPDIEEQSGGDAEVTPVDPSETRVFEPRPLFQWDPRIGGESFSLRIWKLDERGHLVETERWTNLSETAVRPWRALPDDTYHVWEVTGWSGSPAAPRAVASESRWIHVGSREDRERWDGLLDVMREIDHALERMSHDDGRRFVAPGDGGQGSSDGPGASGPSVLPSEVHGAADGTGRVRHPTEDRSTSEIHAGDRRLAGWHGLVAVLRALAYERFGLLNAASEEWAHVLARLPGDGGRVEERLRRLERRRLVEPRLETARSGPVNEPDTDPPHSEDVPPRTR
jgi:hypothetical protein